MQRDVLEHFSDCNLALVNCLKMMNACWKLPDTIVTRLSICMGNVNRSRIHVWSSSDSGMRIAVLFFLKKGTN